MPNLPGSNSSATVLVAGASGIIGRQVLPELATRGYRTLGLTRSGKNARMIEQLGAMAAVCDIYDPPALEAIFEEYAPEIVIDLLTDLPDEADRVREYAEANNRMRTVGTDNLLGAATKGGARRIIAESVAWQLPGNGAIAVAHLEEAVLSAGGVVLRYGQLWGAQTYHMTRPTTGPTLRIDTAGRRTIQLIDAVSGIYELVDEPLTA